MTKTDILKRHLPFVIGVKHIEKMKLASDLLGDTHEELALKETIKKVGYCLLESNNENVQLFVDWDNFIVTNHKDQGLSYDDKNTIKVCLSEITEMKDKDLSADHHAFCSAYSLGVLHKCSLTSKLIHRLSVLRHKAQFPLGRKLP